jgi:hypothetical protein
MLRYFFIATYALMGLGSMILFAQELNNDLVIILEDERYLSVPDFSIPSSLEYSMEWEPDQREFKKNLLAALIAPFPLPEVDFPSHEPPTPRILRIGGSAWSQAWNEAHLSLLFGEFGAYSSFSPEQGQINLLIDQWNLRGKHQSSRSSWQFYGDLPIPGLMNNHIRWNFEGDNQVAELRSSFSGLYQPGEYSWDLLSGVSQENLALSSLLLGTTWHHSTGSISAGVDYELNPALAHPLIDYHQSFDSTTIQVWNLSREAVGGNLDRTGIALTWFTVLGEWRLAYQVEHSWLRGSTDDIGGLASLDFTLPLFLSVHPLAIGVSFKHEQDFILWGGGSFSSGPVE